MNRTRLLMIGFLALALGAFVSYSVYRSLQARAGAGNVPGDDVVIAKGDLAVGSKITEEDVKLVHFPAGDLPPNCFHQKSRVVGRGVVAPIARGEFILPTKLAGENAGSGLPALIPPGMRAVSVRVNEIVSVAGFVQPGTRVDVLLTGNPTGASDQQTTTVLENVLVLATGQKLERSTNADAQAAAVITLEVSPDDAQKLTLASSQGHIQLSLRNPLDTKQEGISVSHSNSLYKISDKPVVVAHAKVKREVHAPPSVYTVEMIRGEKKDEVKF